MKMQNLDFTAIYIPGKSNMTDSFKTCYQKPKRLVMSNTLSCSSHENQPVKGESILQKLMKTLEMAKWSRNEPDLASFYDLRAEMH